MSFHDTTSETQDVQKGCCGNAGRNLNLEAPFSNEKDDLSSSFQFSNNSPIVTEDLLLNEKIEFCLSESEPSSEPMSLTYTKSLNSGLSSIFPSVEGSNFFMNSVPHSHEASFSGSKKFELSAPQPFWKENQLEYLKIPNLTQMSLKRLKELSEENSKTQIEFLENSSDPEKLGQYLETPGFDPDPDPLKSTGKDLLHPYTEESHKCSCEWCVIL